MKKFFIYLFCIFFYTELYGIKYDSLINNSPFCRHKSLTAHPANEENAGKDFELHGIWAFEDEFLFSIHDKNTNKNFWVPLNGKQGEMSVKNFYPKDGMIEILLPNGDLCLLKLKTATSAQLNTKTNAKLTDHAPDKQMVSGRTKERFLDFMNEQERR